jgi:hypothetical protein
MASTFTLISSTTVGSGGVSTVTFSSIPSTYNDLMLYSSSRLTVSSRYDGLLRMNSVTSGYRYVFGEGYATDSIYTSSSNAYGGQDILMNPSNHTANYFSGSEIYISNYNSTGVKPTSYYQCDPSDSAATFYIQTGTGTFPSGAAISSLTIAPNAGSIAQHSSFHLYGISYT